MTTTPILSLTFQLLAICGCWRPVSFTSPYKKVMYDIFSVFAVFSVYSFTFSQIINLFDVNDIDDLIEKSYLTLSAIGSFCKITNILICRKNIVEIIDSLSEDPYRPVNDAEILIQVRYDKIARINTLQYAIMIETSVTSSILNSLMIDYKNRKLPYSDWLPYDYSSIVRFRLSYFYQSMSMVMCSMLHVAVDALICGLLIHMCCQIEILESRIKSITKRQQSTLYKYVWHHNCIYRLAAKLMETFQIIISCQFLISALVLCVSLYRLVNKDILSIEFLSTILYLSTLLVQIFLYCWYANEVKLKSARISEIIFESDWAELSNSFKRDLIFMMQRATYPIEFNLLHILDVNLDSFMNLIKSSYSVYNILQHNQK